MVRDYLKQLSQISLLKPDEENLLWEKYKIEQHLDSRQRIIEAYQPLVFKIVSRFSAQPSLQMDLIQEGTIGLIEAVEAFEPQRGVKFSTFAQHRIKGRMITFLRSIGTNISLDVPTEGYLENVLSSMSTIDIADAIVESQLYQPILQAITRLSPREQEVIRKIFFEHYEANILAQEMNISVSYFYRIQKKALRRLKGMLSKWRAETKIS